MNFLNRISVGGKISILVGILVAALVITNGFAAFEMMQIGDELGALERSAGGTAGAAIERAVVVVHESNTRAIFLLFLVAGIFAVVGIVLAVLVARRISGPLGQLAETLVQVARGEAADIPALDHQDEVGAIARAITQITEAGKEAIRIKVALDNVTTNVMVSDNDNKIIYVNKAVLSMMRRAESDIRNQISGFSADNILGSTFDIFHKNPAHQRSMVAAMQDTYRTKIEIGGRSFTLIANPVKDNQGERLGTVVEWGDITQELAVEKEVQLIVDSAMAGDLSNRVRLDGKEGFMLQLGTGINSLLDTTESALQDIGDMTAALAAGDLTKRITSDYQGLFETLKNNSNEMAERLSDTVGRILAANDQINTASGEVAAGSADLSERTEQQAANLEETAASMEQLSATVRQNAGNASQANTLAAGARDTAEKSGAVVTDAVTAMTGIEQSSRKISDIIGVIDEIAFQTNLLALNAAVEAARAGEAGKGFAVVAQEVRTLAQRSATASKEIKGLILDSNEQVESGVDLVNKAGESLQEIVTAIKRVADIVSEIAAASDEQASGLEQVNMAVSQMDEMTQKNAALVEESAAAARSMEEQAGELTDLMAFFNLDGMGHAPAPRRHSNGAGSRPDAARSSAKAPARAPARTLPKPAAEKMPAPALDDDWKEF